MIILNDTAIVIIIITTILHLSWGVLKSHQVQPSYYSLSYSCVRISFTNFRRKKEKKTEWL